MNKRDVVRMNEDALNQMLEAAEQDRIHQNENSRTLRLELRERSRVFIPDKMPEDFYRGMLSALLTTHFMLPESVSVEHALITIEEIIRVVLDQVIEERARRSMEVA